MRHLSAHSPHDEEYADRSGTKGKAEDGCEGVAHKVKFCKGCDKQVVGSHSVWYGDMVLDGIMKRTSQGFPVSASWHWLGQDRLPSVWFSCTCCNFFTCKQHSVRKVGTDLFVIVQNGNDSVSVAMTFLQYVEKLVGCPCINGIEGFVQK